MMGKRGIPIIAGSHKMVRKNSPIAHKLPDLIKIDRSTSTTIPQQYDTLFRLLALLSKQQQPTEIQISRTAHKGGVQD